jgi:hypothetical protein
MTSERKAFLKKNLLPEDGFQQLKEHFLSHPTFRDTTTSEFKRRMIEGYSDKLLYLYHIKLTSIARQLFNSPTLVPSYSLFVEYVDGANLPKHKDSNACTYTLDLCLYESTPWGIWVDGEEFFMKENDALCFYGEEQEHWREPLQATDVKIGLVFFHYVEPDHWFFSEGPNH